MIIIAVPGQRVGLCRRRWTAAMAPFFDLCAVKPSALRESARDWQAEAFRSEQLRLKAAAAATGGAILGAEAGGAAGGVVGSDQPATQSSLAAAAISRSEGSVELAAAVASVGAAAVPSGRPSKDVALIRRRAAAAIVGAFVADAATMGLHWIYELPDLQVERPPRRLLRHSSTLAALSPTVSRMLIAGSCCCIFALRAQV